MMTNTHTPCTTIPTIPAPSSHRRGAPRSPSRSGPSVHPVCPPIPRISGTGVTAAICGSERYPMQASSADVPPSHRREERLCKQQDRACSFNRCASQPSKNSRAPTSTPRSEPNVRIQTVHQFPELLGTGVTAAICGSERYPMHTPSSGPSHIQTVHQFPDLKGLV
jgi:hypothetical protein